MGLLETIIAVLVVLWLAGFAFNVGGAFIHILVIIALILFIARLLRGRSL